MSAAWAGFWVLAGVALAIVAGVVVLAVRYWRDPDEIDEDAS